MKTPLRINILARWSAVFISLALVIPFITPWHNYPVTTGVTESFAILLCCLAIAPVFVIGSPTVPLMCYGLAGLGVYYFAQIFFLPIHYPIKSVVATFYLLWGAALVYLSYSLRELIGFRFERVIANSLVIGGFLVSVFGFIQYFELTTVIGKFIYANNPVDGLFSTLGQRNHVANYVACALASLVYLACPRFGTPEIKPYIAYPLAIIFATALALTGSRSAAVYFAIILIPVVFAAWRYTKLQYPLEISICAAFVFVYVCQLHTMLPDTTPGAATALERFADSAPSTRTWLYVNALKIIAENPFFGVGFMEWSNYLPPFSAREVVDVNTHAHNLFLQLWLDGGFFGSLFIIVPLGIFYCLFGTLYFGFEYYKLTSNYSREWIITLLCIQFAHAMIEGPHWYAHFLSLACIIIGCGYYYQKDRHYAQN